MKWKVLISTLCLLSCLAIATQVIYESGAVVQGFPASRGFLVIFWWQVASIFIVLFATAIGLAKKFGYSSLTPVCLSLAAAYPLIVAVTAIGPSTWSRWLSMFEIFPREAILRLCVALLPAIFSVSLLLGFLKEIRTTSALIELETYPRG